MAALPVRRGGRNTMVVSPSREFEDIYDRMGQLMNFAFGLTPAALADMPWVPTADLSETDDAYVVKAELPGVNKDQVNIQLQDRELVISGEVPEPENGNGSRRHRAFPRPAVVCDTASDPRRPALGGGAGVSPDGHSHSCCHDPCWQHDPPRVCSRVNSAS